MRLEYEELSIICDDRTIGNYNWKASVVKSFAADIVMHNYELGSFSEKSINHAN